jgi:hypothetical protein
MSIPIDDAISRLAVKPDYDDGDASAPRPCVHTFRNPAPGVIIGAHWGLVELRPHMEKWGVQETVDPDMIKMSHGLMLIDDTGTLWMETRTDPWKLRP